MRKTKKLEIDEYEQGILINALNLLRNQQIRERRLYSINDIVEMSGWSKRVVQKLFNDPDFPSLDYGKAKLVEAHALIAFLSVKHEKELEPYWRKQVRRHGKNV